MTGSSPADLAVTFRSLDRRLKEALDGADAEMAAPLVAQLGAVVAAAAAELGLQGAGQGADLAATGTTIAARIDSISADEWDGAQLDRLRGLGLEAGRLLRSITDLTPSDD